MRRPAQIPDLNPIDFYMWQLFAAKVFDRRPLSIFDLKEAGSCFANSIEPETVSEIVKKSFRKLVNLCYEMVGQHGFA